MDSFTFVHWLYHNNTFCVLIALTLAMAITFSKEIDVCGHKLFWLVASIMTTLFVVSGKDNDNGLIVLSMALLINLYYIQFYASRSKRKESL